MNDHDLLLGATGYIGEAFAAELRRRGKPFLPLSRERGWITPGSTCCWNFCARDKPDFLINAAGYTGKPNVDACEVDTGRHVAGQRAAAADHRPRLRRGRESPGATFPPAASIPAPKLPSAGGCGWRRT